MDELKKYLQQHVHEMDLDTPSPGILHRIKSPEQTPQKARIRPFWYGIAAAASVILLLILGIQYFGSRPSVPLNKTAGETSATAASKGQNAAAIPSRADSASEPFFTTSGPVDKEPVNAVKAADEEPYRLLSSFEAHYSELVNLQVQSIRQSPLYGEPAGYFDDMKIQLRKIADDEAAIKINIRHTGLTDPLLSQLINVYEQKIGLLKNIQAEINRINQKIKENHQPGDSLLTSYLNI